ncbi:DHCW motif cupin fold protein [Pedobacter mucosus]|uniref:DHCW motif cupin fold protein n=1 Tax=Pedobacter mucosus TaxID=2895286 RepID=UPI001EE3C031|nr:DHCW motif cupin fold protein [Pedobacter mucosus]UKT64474.1 DHCW motif cupin fold protein [Pedobacter mucosus]
MYKIPFNSINWDNVEAIEYVGETGMATWQTVNLNGLRLRIVKYSAGYIADHWCQKGHIVQCLAGDFTSEMEDGSQFFLREGMTYIVSENLSSHRSVSAKGVKLLIIDGEFLKP